MRLVSKILVVSFLLVVGQGAALAANPIQTPRPVNPAVDKTDIKAVNALISSLIEEYEGLKVGDNAPGEEDDLQIYTSAKESPCKSTSATEVVCGLGYLQDRWNGVLEATFKTEGSRIVELTKVTTDGNF